MEISPEPVLWIPMILPILSWTTSTKPWQSLWCFVRPWYGGTCCDGMASPHQFASSLAQAFGPSWQRSDPVFRVKCTMDFGMKIYLWWPTGSRVYKDTISTLILYRLTQCSFGNTQWWLHSFYGVSCQAAEAKPSLYLFDKADRCDWEVQTCWRFCKTSRIMSSSWNACWSIGLIANGDGKIYPYLFWEGA